MLYEGGFIADTVPAAERKDALDFLYRKLVVDDREEDAPATLADKCSTLFSEVGLAERGLYSRLLT